MDKSNKPVERGVTKLWESVNDWAKKQSKVVNDLVSHKKSTDKRIDKLERELKDTTRKVINSDRRNDYLAKQVKRLQLENERSKETIDALTRDIHTITKGR